MPTQKFRVRGLRHEDEERVAARLRALPGVYYATLNHEVGCAEVDFDDDSITTAEIRAALAGLGLEAQLAG